MRRPASKVFMKSLGKITATNSVLKTLLITTCAICIDEFKHKEDLLQLPNCHHLFHNKCLLQWFETNNTCPLCRHVFPLERLQCCSLKVRADNLCLPGQQLPFSQQPGEIVSLHFYLRPTNLNSQQTSEMGFLQQLLISSGCPQLAKRACGPFWIKTIQSVHNQPLI